MYFKFHHRSMTWIAIQRKSKSEKSLSIASFGNFHFQNNMADDSLIQTLIIISCITTTAILCGCEYIFFYFYVISFQEMKLWQKFTSFKCIIWQRLSWILSSRHTFRISRMLNLNYISIFRGCLLYCYKHPSALGRQIIFVFWNTTLSHFMVIFWKNRWRMYIYFQYMTNL